MNFRTDRFAAILCLVVFVVECRRSGGGGRRTSAHRPSPAYHPPAYHPPAYHPPAYHPPAYHPPAYHPPAYHPPAYHPPSSNHPSPHNAAPANNFNTHGTNTGRPIGFVDPHKPSESVATPKRNNPVGSAPSHETGAVRPLGFVDPHKPSAPVGPPKHSQPEANVPTRETGNTGPSRPIGFDGVQHPHSSNSGKSEIPKHSSPVGNAPPPYTPGNYGQNPPPYNPHYNPGSHGVPPPAYNPAGYGPPPAYTPGNYHNAYHPQGYGPPNYGHGGYHPQGQPYGSGGGVTIINNNVNNHQHGSYGGYGGWGYSPPVYTSYDTGSSALGFFLGYSLAKISTPSYVYHNSYYDGNVPRYDHYTVHHYYHNRETVPKEATIESNSIVACIGDAGSFCPANTTSLCTNNGAVMCVASATSTVPCTDNKQTNCVKSVVPCTNNSGPECQQSSKNSTSISIPCISTAKVYGSLSYVNDSIVVSNLTDNAKNELLNQNATVPNDRNTTANFTLTDSQSNNSTVAANNTEPVNVTNHKDPPQMFCVTVLALPAERKLSEGEKLFIHSKNIFSKFAVNALGLE